MCFRLSRVWECMVTCLWLLVVFWYKYLALIPIQWYSTKMGLLKLCTYLIGCFVWQDIHVVSENYFCLLNIWVNKFHLKFHRANLLLNNITWNWHRRRSHHWMVISCFYFFSFPPWTNVSKTDLHCLFIHCSYRNSKSVPLTNTRF